MCGCVGADWSSDWKHLKVSLMMKILFSLSRCYMTQVISWTSVKSLCGPDSWQLNQKHLQSAMHSNVRICKYLSLTTQLFWKFPGIRIATDKFPHFCQFCKTNLPPRVDGSITSKHISITSTTRGLQDKDVSCHHLYQTFEVNSVPYTSFHSSTEKISQSISRCVFFNFYMWLRVIFPVEFFVT